MKLFRTLLVVALCVAYAAGQAAVNTTTTDASSTTAGSTVAETTAKADVDVTNTTTTDVPPTSSSTTVAPSTSTEPAPTTTETSSTTEVPSSSTTEAPSTTPNPKSDKWIVTDKEGKICMLVKSKITITSGKESVDVPKEATTGESMCEHDKVTLDLIWPRGNESEGNRLQIIVNVTETEFSVASIDIDVADIKVSKSDLDQFKTEVGKHYQCNPQTAVKIDSSVTISFTDMEYQAFPKGADKADFTGGLNECAGEKRNNVLVVAIGCAMGVLVIVILVGYLIARRRNRQSGYQSV